MKNETAKIIIAIGYSLLFITPFIWNMDIMYSILMAKTFYFYAVSALLFTTIIIYLIMIKHTAEIKLNLLDITIIVFLTYQFFRLLFTEYSSLDNDKFIIQLLLTVHYFILRTLFKNERAKFILICLFLLAGLGQAVYGMLQLYNLNPGYPVFRFKIIGTLINPNSYAGYLITVLPFSFGLYEFIIKKDGKYKVIKYLGIISAGIILLILPSTYTRAAWLGGAVGLLYVLYLKFEINIKAASLLNTHLKKTTAVLTTFILIILLFSSLYNLKPDSAFGRLFIWKVTAQMIKEKPLFGHGYDKYKVEYNNYQTKYFEEGNGTDYEKKVAGNNKQAFNDYIQLTAESGIIGLLLFLIIIYQAMFSKIVKFKPFAISARASLLSIIIFAFFSYPIQYLVTQANLFFIMALISSSIYSKIFYIYKFKPQFENVILVATLLLLFSLYVNKYKNYIAYKEWKIAFSTNRAGLLQEAIKNSKKIYPVLNIDGNFLFFYGGLLYKAGQYKKAHDIFIETKNYFSDPNLCILLAQTSVKLQEYIKAENYYKHAIFMVPHKFYPRYLLVDLYQRTGELEKSYAVARDIIKLKIKVNSKAVRTIKKEMEELLTGQR